MSSNAVSVSPDIVDFIPDEGIVSAELYKKCDWFEAQVHYAAALGRAIKAGRAHKRDDGVIFKGPKKFSMSDSSEAAKKSVTKKLTPKPKPESKDDAVASSSPQTDIHPALVAINEMSKRLKIVDPELKCEVLCQLGRILDPSIGKVLLDIAEDLEAMK